MSDSSDDVDGIGLTCLPVALVIATLVGFIIWACR